MLGQGPGLGPGPGPGPGPGLVPGPGPEHLFDETRGIGSIIPARPQPGSLGHFWIFICNFWVRRGLQMILRHRAPSSLNMSSYRAMWTHFKPNFIFV